MISSLPPGLLLMLGACLLPLFPGRLKIGWMLALPVLSFLQLLQLPDGALIQFTLFDYTLTPVRVDRLSLIFGYVFHLAAFLSALYAAHVKDTVQHVAGLIYAGSAIAAVFAGDMISLFVNWELTAVSSVFLIWASRTEAAFRVGMRYMLIQVGSGVILLAGVLLIVADTGSLEFSRQALVGAAPDANAVPIPKEDADKAMDAAACIGCGACVAACPNASASLFVSAKISQLSYLPQGLAERHRRALRMIAQMDKEGFGDCSNHGECEGACPKEISIETIARMRREFITGAFRE